MVRPTHIARAVAAAGLLAAVAAVAAPDSWTKGGTPASAAARVLTPLEPQKGVPFPRDLVAKLTGPTVLFYFSPTCPHCRAVAPEVQALATQLGEHGVVIGIGSGSSTASDLLAFQTHYGLTFEVVHDSSREIVTAMGARSTPSALLVTPAGRGKVDVHELWYPYMPGYDGLIEGRVRGDPWSVFRPGEYKSDGFCGSCHAIEASSLSMTHHAIAWRTLKKRNKTDDAACTPCHVTGAGQPTGWDGDPESRLVDVGCEACHGPGGHHDGIRDDPREACVRCHDEKHSLAFEVEAGVALLDHYKILDTEEAEFDRIRRALWDGELPRQLLRFEEGANVGAAACLTCHPTQHAQWSASPHANAMSSLRPDNKGAEVACVRCHATATTSGVPPTTLAGFRTLEGVGCESCHGPGEAHVAAGGGTGNIERLGDDCPVCVIEAVCTGCHTPEWDPLWDLEDDLPKVGHGTVIAPP